MTGRTRWLIATAATMLAGAGLGGQPEAAAQAGRAASAIPAVPGAAQPGDAACPPGWCDAVPGRVLIKVAGSGTRRVASAVAADLQGPLASYGVGDLVPVFPHATPPRRGARVFGPDGSAQPVPDLTRWFAASIREGADPQALADNLRKVPGIEMAEPDYLRRPIGTPGALGQGQKQEARSKKESRGSDVSRPTSYASGPAPHVPRPTPHVPDLPAFNDPLLAQQWHLDAVNAPAAWAWLESQGLPPGGARGIVVAVIDTGVDYLHPDLAANIWTNAQEIPANGVDDDANGYVDDVHGIDATNGDAAGNPMDDHGHGTHVAGIIAAQADNGAGGVGVAWNVQIMAIKAAQYSGVLATSDIAEGLYYAAAHGADVINMSFGGYVRSQIEEDALAVAFGQAVLVAAAGNDGKPNDWSPDLMCGFPIPIRRMYPANHNWVLGVMASAPAGARAPFSNFDCIARNTNEYELLAPGTDIWSALPGAQYAAWDGTSMAAPVVSGIAALVRTAKPDKDSYSSRFIMGQIASNAGPVANAVTALTTAPQPHLSYLRHWIFDSKSLSANNDGDGVVDAGETIDFAIVIRNHWGKADNVTVTIEAQADGAPAPDPFVTIDPATVDYGAVGNFGEDDNGLLTDEHGEYIGVLHPFRAVVSASAPNNHVIPFQVTMTGRNGFDAGDPTIYTTTSRFTVAVQRGRELPRVIESDTTLTADDLWIVRDATMVQAGVTLTIGPGTHVQFWGNEATDPYAEETNAFLVVNGTLNVAGTVDDPVYLAPSDLYSNRMVEIRAGDYGVVSIAYAEVVNPRIARFDTHGTAFQSGRVDHVRFTQSHDWLSRRSATGWEDYSNPIVMPTLITHSVFRGMGTGWETQGQQGLVLRSRVESSLFDGVRFVLTSDDVRNSVFLKNGRMSADGRWMTAAGQGAGSSGYDPVFLWSLAPEVYDGRTYVHVASQGGLGALTPAERFAQWLGGHVVTVNDETENVWLADKIQRFPGVSLGDRSCGYMSCRDVMWPGGGMMGLSDSAVEGTFAWSSGEASEYRNFYSLDNTKQLGPTFTYIQTDGKWFCQSYVGPMPWVFEIPGELTQQEIDAATEAYKTSRAFNAFRNNAILNFWNDPGSSRWLRWFAPQNAQDPANWHFYLTDNFWGGATPAMIDASIQDWYNDFFLPKYIYEPVLATPPETAYPFVVDVVTSSGGTPSTRVGPGPVTFTITFNRDMDQTVQPQVSFGPDTPVTDFAVHPIDGGWQNARTWVGTFTITPITGDGYQLIRVAGARAADDAWLVTGDDAGRFRFEIITSGTESMNLQATGGEGFADLTWTQNDFELLAGFHLYRATAPDGPFTRLNTSLIPADVHAYRDAEVDPGQPYYYQFTVVKSDMTESSSSNVATATPTDTVAPVLLHTPVVNALPGLALTIAADVTDNVRVAGATLYYRAANQSRIDLYTPGRAEALHYDALHYDARHYDGRGYAPGAYTALAMTNISGARFTATIDGTNVQAPGLEYYIEATDGITITHSGWPETPWLVTVLDRPAVTAVSPAAGPASGGTDVVVVGSNLKAGATVSFGGTACTPVTRDSENQLRCTTGAHFPAAVDVTVTNPDAATGTLLRGYTYEADTATVSLPDAAGGQGAVVQVPVMGTTIAGLASALVDVRFDATLLRARRVVTGTLTPGWTVVPNLGTEGRALVAIVSPSGTASGSGSLMQIEFDVLGLPGASAPLHLESASLNDGAIPVTITDGSFTVDHVYDVNGRVTFWNGGAAVPGALLTLTGDRVFTATTGPDGAFTIAGAPRDAYTLTPSKSTEATGISAFDASLVLQHTVELIALSGHAATAADVTRDGQIRLMDAFYILQRAADLIALPFPGAGRVWDFAPPNRSLADLTASVADQDFTAVLLGDVSGNWSASAPTSLIGSRGRFGETPTAAHVRLKPDATTTGNQSGIDLREAGGATFVLPSLDAAPGATIQVPMTLTRGATPFLSAELTLTYDPAVVTATGVSLGAVPANWLLAANTTVPGEIRIAMAGTAGVATDGEFLVLTFTVNGTRGTSTPLAFASLTLDDGQVAGTGTAGEIRVPVCAYTLEPNEADVAPAGGSGSFDVRAPVGCAWTAASQAAWLIIDSGTAGTGDGTVSYTAEANAGAAARLGTIVAGGQTFTLHQNRAACTYRIGPASKSIPAAGGTGTITVTTQPGCEWTAETAHPWITFPGSATGLGSGKVSYAAGANPSSQARPGTVTIEGLTHAVNQGGVVCGFRLDPSLHLAGPDGGPAAVSIDATADDCPWTATSPVPWVTLDAAGGTGDATLGVTVGAKTDKGNRTARLRVGGKPLVVKQTGCSFTISPTIYTLPAAGGPVLVTVTATGSQCAWTAVPKVPWIKVLSPVPVVGSGEVQLVVDPNTGRQARTGAAIIAGKTFKVLQTK